jgi:hypothetical protein
MSFGRSEAPVDLSSVFFPKTLVIGDLGGSYTSDE